MAVNFTTPQGDTFTRTFVIKDSNGTPIDLTDYNFRSQLRDSEDGLVADIIVAKLDINTVSIKITSNSTQSISIGIYNYDVEMFTSYDEYVVKIFNGTFEITK
ncbi:MAG: hypothetical protein U9O94_04125, partial [Nanoarchaeota archaeon]|nr:hypothetical protein [Nanoarchaeota archaeon]